MLDLARKKVEAQGLSGRISFVKSDVTAVELPDNTAEFVISLNTLHFPENPQNMLAEVQRLLKDDGQYMITDVCNNIFGLALKPLKLFYTYKEFKNMIKMSVLSSSRFRKGLFWIDIVN